jgi:hypothetical protein
LTTRQYRGARTGDRPRHQLIDTAFDHGNGPSERVLGGVVRASGRRLGHEFCVATSIPALTDGEHFDSVFPDDHIREYVQSSSAANRVCSPAAPRTRVSGAP